MEGILEFLQTPLGQIIILVVVSVFFGKNPDLINKILEILQIQKPKTPEQKQVILEKKLEEVQKETGKASIVISPEVDLENKDENEPDRNDAFIAANLLIEYFEEQGEECKDGLEAAKKAGQCLFH